MRSGGWAKGRKKTKLIRVDEDVHKLALCLSLQMILPMKAAVEMAIRKMAKEHGVEL